ncbi:MAG: carboxypeptidase regulatory-like domain-containing protein [Myxococcales bacterium]|nr:carboxypeptidase regulatory-like domain-containing protein [Myxococcales bacterium]
MNMHYMRAICAGLCLSVLAACGGGPISLTGRVLDQKGAPVAKAEVFTEPETDVVMTNNRGFFTLRQRLNDSGEAEAIKSGDYKIKVRKFGFNDAAFAVKIQGGPTKVPDLVLSPRTPDINETAPDPTLEKVFQNDDMSTPVQGN